MGLTEFGWSGADKTAPRFSRSRVRLKPSSTIPRSSAILLEPLTESITAKRPIRDEVQQVAVACFELFN